MNHAYYFVDTSCCLYNSKFQNAFQRVHIYIRKLLDPKNANSQCQRCVVLFFCILMFNAGMHECLEELLTRAKWKLKLEWNISFLWHSTTFSLEFDLI